MFSLSHLPLPVELDLLLARLLLAVQRDLPLPQLALPGTQFNEKHLASVLPTKITWVSAWDCLHTPRKCSKMLKYQNGRVSSGHGHDRSVSSKIETGSKFLTMVITVFKIWPTLAIKVCLNCFISKTELLEALHSDICIMDSEFLATYHNSILSLDIAILL